MGCVGIKRTEDGAVPDWKGQNGEVFAKYMACMGLVQREIDEQRFNECPCLLITIEKPTDALLTSAIENIIQMVSQNKLNDLLSQLTAESATRSGLGTGVETGVRTETSVASEWRIPYDPNAEFRTRLLALREWLRRMFGYETFDVGLKALPLIEEDWFVMNGPVYIFLQSTTTGGLARVLFPSMTKNGSQFISYDNLAKSHRWVDRFINSVIYTTSADGCNMPCTNYTTTYSSYRYNWRMARCLRQKYYMRCGRSDVKTGDSKDPKIVHSAIYEVNLNYSPIASGFARATIRAPVYSILPSDWDMYAGTRQMVMSENRKWFMVLKGDTLGVYENRNNVDLVAMTRTEPSTITGVFYYGIKFAGQASRLVLESGVLTIYGKPMVGAFDDNQILWKMELAKEGTQPMALYLHDNGQLSMFDGDNKNVLDMAALNEQLDRTERVVEFAAEYNPADEYKRRFQQLLDWLRVRNLLYEYLSDTNVTIDYQGIHFEDMSPSAPYDRTINYRQRLLDLLVVLQIKYPTLTLPSDEEVQRVFSITYQHENESTTAYDPVQVRAERVRALTSL